VLTAAKPFSQVIFCPAGAEKSPARVDVEVAMFFLISGAAASGKTTVARTLARQMADLECHDADEVPATTIQQRWQYLEQWVQRALVAQAQGTDFLLTSHSPLGELLTCPSAPQLTGIATCLLDCDDLVRIARIRARGIDPRWPPNQHTFNWASWHRMHAADPRWEAQVITQSCPFPQHLVRWSDWIHDDPRWRVERMDTTSLAVADTIHVVQDWIGMGRRQSALLGSSSSWWGKVPETE
jgi:hypothetical protein